VILLDWRTIGLDWIGLDWIGFGWTGFCRFIALDWIGLDRLVWRLLELQWLGSQRIAEAIQNGRVEGMCVPQEIFIDGHPVEVTWNLHAALYHIRQSTPSGHRRILWVDALCIYSHRTTMKYLGTLRFPPQFFEGFHSSELGILS
jgi:hypothetical protein